MDSRQMELHVVSVNVLCCLSTQLTLHASANHAAKSTCDTVRLYSDTLSLVKYLLTLYKLS